MWNSLWLWCFSPFQKGLQTLRWTSRCSSRCPSRCAIHYGYRAWTFPYFCRDTGRVSHRPGGFQKFFMIFHKRLFSDSVKRHLRGRHLSVLNLKFDFISDGGRTREEQIALSLKRHLFPHGGREPKAFWICFSRVHPPSEIKSNFKFKTLKRHLLKRHLTLSDFLLPN